MAVLKAKSSLKTILQKRRVLFMKKRITAAVAAVVFLLGVYHFFGPKIKKLAAGIGEFVSSLKLNAIRENQRC